MRNDGVPFRWSHNPKVGSANSACALSACDARCDVRTDKLMSQLTNEAADSPTPSAVVPVWKVKKIQKTCLSCAMHGTVYLAMRFSGGFLSEDGRVP